MSGCQRMPRPPKITWMLARGVCRDGHLRDGLLHRGEEHSWGARGGRRWAERNNPKIQSQLCNFWGLKMISQRCFVRLQSKQRSAPAASMEKYTWGHPKWQRLWTNVTKMPGHQVVSDQAGIQCRLLPTDVATQFVHIKVQIGEENLPKLTSPRGKQKCGVFWHSTFHKTERKMALETSPSKESELSDNFRWCSIFKKQKSEKVVKKPAVPTATRLQPWPARPVVACCTCTAVSLICRAAGVVSSAKLVRWGRSDGRLFDSLLKQH